jgi:CRISPR-associated protein Csd2
MNIQNTTALDESTSPAAVASALDNKIELVIVFDVVNGNPNGDPDMGNRPRLNPHSRKGIVSDVCLKRKVRNAVAALHTGEAGCEIYVTRSAVLDDAHRKAYEAVRGGKQKPKVVIKPKDLAEEGKLMGYMSGRFFDVRAFGGVMASKAQIGRLCGPVQFTMAESVDPISPMELTITRMAGSNEAGNGKSDEADGEEAGGNGGSNQTMGSKWIVPYGLYVGRVYISAMEAKRTGFSEADLQLLIDAIRQMFEFDRSAGRGEMRLRKLVMFRHENAKGNAPSHQLVRRVKVTNVTGTEFPSENDYEITVDESDMPAGVMMQIMV